MPEGFSGALSDRLSIDEIGLFVDADGTLLDIASRPELVVAPDGLVETLDRAYAALDGALAIVSGRRIEDLDCLFAPLRLPASGVHGAQLRRARNASITAAAPAVPDVIAIAVRAAAAAHPGAFVEDKQVALAVHWRACPQARRAIYAELARILASAAAEGLTILDGHCVFEVKPAGASKGDAVRAFMQSQPFARRRPVFIGDDTTDLAGFAAAQALGGYAFSVSMPVASADGCFAGPADVRAWLAALARVHADGAHA